MPGVYSSQSGDYQRFRLPLSYRFVRLLYESAIEGRGTSYERLLELCVMKDVAFRDGFVSCEEEHSLQELHQFLERKCRHAPRFVDHSGTYSVMLRHLYTFIYSEDIESTDQWKDLAQRIDGLQRQMYPGEYDYLIILLNRSSSEIENATYIEYGHSELVQEGSGALNCTSYSELRSEGYKLLEGSGYSNKLAGELFLCKVNLAFSCNKINGKQWEELRKLSNVRKVANAWASAIIPMDLFGRDA